MEDVEYNVKKDPLERFEIRSHNIDTALKFDKMKIIEERFGRGDATYTLAKHIYSLLLLMREIFYASKRRVIQPDTTKRFDIDTDCITSFLDLRATRNARTSDDYTSIIEQQGVSRDAAEKLYSSLVKCSSDLSTPSTKRDKTKAEDLEISLACLRLSTVNSFVDYRTFGWLSDYLIDFRVKNGYNQVKVYFSQDAMFLVCSERNVGQGVFFDMFCLSRVEISSMLDPSVKNYFDIKITIPSLRETRDENNPYVHIECLPAD